MTSTNYTKSFKIEAVKKVLLKGPGVTILSIAQELNLHPKTLYNWVRYMKSQINDPASPLEEKSAKRPSEWTKGEKFDAVIEANRLTGEDLNAFCRKMGIFPHHLTLWKQEFMNTSQNPSSTALQEIKALKNEIKRLQAELNRKDKALAETTALLVLKKKVDLLLGGNEEP